MSLEGKRVGVLAEDYYQELELWYPVLRLREAGAEVVIVEVGGTVGDIEGLPFLEALRQMRKDAGRDNTLYMHVTLLPHIAATGELKT